MKEEEEEEKLWQNKIFVPLRVHRFRCWVGL